MKYGSLLLVLALACGPAAAPSSSAAPTGASSGSSGAESPAADAPSLAGVIAGEQRSAENRARDPYRHPQETLEFFGLRPDLHVVEIRPGRGWYTEILAPYLQPEGHLVVGIPSADGPTARYRQGYLDTAAAHPEVFGAIEVGTFSPNPEGRAFELGADGSADLVLTFRNTHNWIRNGVAEDAYAAFFRVLRPGGVLGVVQHRAPATDDETSEDTAAWAAKGYVSEATLIAIAEAAGFVLEERAEINANPADTHDYPEGVWTLPPTYRLGDVDHARYEAIGESDRMTLRFRKPE